MEEALTRRADVNRARRRGERDARRLGHLVPFTSCPYTAPEMVRAWWRGAWRGRVRAEARVYNHFVRACGQVFGKVAEALETLARVMAPAVAARADLAPALQAGAEVERG